MLAVSAKSPAFWLVLGALAAAGALAWWRYFQVYHLETVDAGVLYRDGNRGLREFANMVRKIRPRTVVCLLDDQELADPAKPQFAREIEFLKAQGIAFERIPVRLGGWPTTQDIQRFLAIVRQEDRRPVVVHCAQGVRRTGMFVAAYQESVLGWSDQQARDRLLTFGHSQRTVKDVQRFIEVYDARSGQVTATLEQSDE